MNKHDHNEQKQSFVTSNCYKGKRKVVDTNLSTEKTPRPKARRRWENMTAAVLDGIKYAEKVQRREVKPSKLREAAKKIHNITEAVESSWNEIPENLQEDLEDIAYRLIEPPKKRCLIVRVFSFVRVAFYAFYLKFTGQYDDLLYCLNELDKLVDSVLNAIEQEQPHYHGVLSDTLEELESESADHKVLGAEEESDWLRKLSDQALT